MKKLLFLVLVSSTTVASVMSFEDRIESATNIALTAKVIDGKILIEAEQESTAANLIKEQLLYSVGHLNGYGGGANISQSVITIEKLNPIRTGELEVKYNAEFVIAWPRESQFPSQFRAFFPLSSDNAGKEAFYAEYGASCSQPGEPSDPYSFFYYFRPQQRGCVALSGSWNPSVTIPTAIQLSPSPLQTKGKSPEYKKIWEDNQLVVTMLFGTYEDNVVSEQDQGVRSYNQVYQSLRQTLGQPQSMNVNLGNQNPGLRYPDLEMTYAFQGGRKLNIVMLLNQKSFLQRPSAKFLERYNARTQISDIVSYNGHSGLGANIRALAKLGKFTPGHYQVYFVNGCDTFTYVDTSITERVAEVNAGEKGTKYLDLITNALPSPFNGFSRNALALIQAGLGAKQTYRELLSRFELSERPLVTGEEDNE